MEDFAGQLCETMSRSTGWICAVTDRDTVIAVAGGGKRELMGKRITAELEQVMESRRIYQYTGEGDPLAVCDGNEKLLTGVAAPILSEGDLLGLVLLISPAPMQPSGGYGIQTGPDHCRLFGKAYGELTGYSRGRGPAAVFSSCRCGGCA